MNKSMCKTSEFKKNRQPLPTILSKLFLVHIINSKILPRLMGYCLVEMPVVFTV